MKKVIYKSEKTLGFLGGKLYIHSVETMLIGI